MKRRSFLTKSLQLGALTGIASHLPVFNIISRPLKSEKGLGVALVGLGNYATNQLAPALQQTKKCYLSAIVTGSPDKADSWSKKYSIPDNNIYNYDSFDEIASNKDVDVIYIVLPNGMHAEYTIRGAEAGKHMICEKPMANTTQECRDMISACAKANVKLGIGYRLHYDPFNLDMMRIGQNKVYGKLDKVEGGFAFTLRNRNAWRLNKELAGGGPLMDVGIYVIQGCIYTIGQLPINLKAQNTTVDKDFFNSVGVEGSLKWTMDFPGGLVANCETSYEDGYNYLKGYTKKGTFEIDPAYSYGSLKGSTPDGPMKFVQVNQQAQQMDAYATSVLFGEKLLVPGEMGLRDMMIIEKIYESAQTNTEVKLKDLPKVLHLV